MRTIKRVIAGVCFIALLIGAVAFEGRIMHPEDTASGSSYSMWDNYYAEEDNSIEVALIGSSAIYRYWIAPQAYEEQGYTSFLISSENQPFEAAPYIMEEAVKTQRLKLIVVETRNIVKTELESMSDKTEAERQSAAEERTHYFSEVSAGMKLSLNKIRMITSLLDEGISSKLEWTLPLLKYHENEYTISEDERVSRLNGKKSIYKSATQTSKVAALEVKAYEPDESTVLSEEGKANIDAVIKKADEMGVEVLFVATPYNSDSAQKTGIQRAIDKYMGEKGYEYLNMGDIEEMGLDYSTDFYNDGHVNISGGRKCTSYLAKYIAEKYEMDMNAVDENNKEQWEKACELWIAREEQLMKKWENNAKGE